MLLAIDTATRVLSIALHDGARVRYECTWESDNQATAELMPAIRRACDQTGVGAYALTRIAVCIGPGSFSGLRIGVATAKGLAESIGVPLIGVPTLDIIAAAQPPGDRPLIAVAQVGRGRVCMQKFVYHDHTCDWQGSGSVAIVGWDALLATIDGPVTLVGEIDPTGMAAIDGSAKNITIPRASLRIRRAAVLADLALDMPDSEAAQVNPLYVNQPGASHP